MMTDKFNPRDVAQLDALMELANGATRGPFKIGTREIIGEYSDIATVHGVEHQPTDDGCGQGWVYILAPYPEEHDKDSRLNSAKLFAASREAVPALIEEVKRLRNALQFITDLDGEINPSNYGHDDACHLNDQFVQAILAADEALQAEGV